MAGKFIQFRIDPALAQRLDDDARAAGVTRSDMARYHLERALGSDAARTAAKTVLWSILAKLRQNETSLTVELGKVIERYIGGTFASEQEGPGDVSDEEQWGEGATDGIPRDRR